MGGSNGAFMENMFHDIKLIYGGGILLSPRCQIN